MRAALSVLFLLASLGPAQAPAKMKFDEVKEVAPGVFFRYSAISPDGKVFGGSNHVWVVFEDYVAVIDANFPKEAGDVIKAIRKTTDKPIRYVFDTHHHGDHAWGNAVWVKEGATVIAQRNCADILRKFGPDEFADGGKGPAGRKDVAASVLKVPSLVFDDKLVLDDGKQRVEFLHMGHSHTIGDAVAYLPRHKILCTGDACVNGPYNFMGHSDSASWVRCLEKMRALDVKLVCPGHGLPMGPELLDNQRKYFVELRKQVAKGLADGKELADIQKAIDMPWYKEWTTVAPAADNVKHVYNEMCGLVSPPYPDFDPDFAEGLSPTKADKGWTKPKRIVVPGGLMAGRLAELKRIAPEVEFRPAKSPEQAVELVADADAVVGFALTPELAKAGKKLRWVQAPPGSVSPEAAKALPASATLTTARATAAPEAADQTFALLLALTRNLRGKGKLPPAELSGKTVLVIGRGARVAKRAEAFGARVREIEGDAAKHLPEADVVVLASGKLGTADLKAMKRGSLLVSTSPGGVDYDALAEALGDNVAGAGIDTAGEPPPPRPHALWKQANAVVTSVVGNGPETEARLWRLYRENVRRFTTGERLLEPAR